MKPAVSVFLFIFILGNLSYSGNFEPYDAPGKLSVKIKRAFITKVNPSLFTQGRLGIAAIDSINLLNHAHSVERYFKYFKVKEAFGRPNDLDLWFKIYFDKNSDLQKLLAQYSSLDEILVAETIKIAPLYATPNDPQYSLQWHLNQTNDADIDAPEAWDIFTGDTTIIVGMTDTGVKWFHTDLAGSQAVESNHSTIKGNMWINYSELNGVAAIDDDVNGYVDDWVGWDFVTGNPELLNLGDDYDVADNDPRDYNGHGTHCAGNVSAVNNNGINVCSAGGGWGEDANGKGNGVKIMALRIGWDDFPSGRVSWDFAAEAFTYAADNGAKIVSCSWGSGDNAALTDATNYFLYNTTSPVGTEPMLRLIFKAAGNDGKDLGTASGDYLIDREDVITVAATDANDYRASFSNYGAVVDISAPGDNIYSTSINSNGYESLSGTSMATPIAASVAALVWSYNPALSATSVRKILFESADPLSDPGMGAGRVNAYNALTHPDISLPVELSSFTARYEQNHIMLQWNTQSEIENLGFNVWRQSPHTTGYQRIATFKENPALKGMGNASYGRTYQFSDADISSGTYHYKLEDVDFSGKHKFHGPVEVTVPPMQIIPAEPQLSQNFPNPFNPVTKFFLTIPENSAATIAVVIFNLLGKKIRVIYTGDLKGGTYPFRWDGKDNFGHEVSAGVYLCRLKSGRYYQTRKMLLIR